jgi:hypothetical protein
MQSSQRQRLRLEAMPKRISPRRPGDASLITQMVRFGASVRQPKERLSAGNMTLLSSETVTDQKANCSICQNPPQVTVVKSCCVSPTTTPYPTNGWRPPKPYCCTGEVNGPAITQPKCCS